jgi:hypothetical protein
MEIGRILHWKSESGNRKMDDPPQKCQSNLSFSLSDFQCRIRPVSFPCIYYRTSPSSNVMTSPRLSVELSGR